MATPPRSDERADPPKPGEAEVEVHHAPKAFHGWREFAKEYGIIVLGVLTALALDQAVEAMHWSHRIHDAVEAMRLEMRDDNGPQGYVRFAAEKCFDRQLDGIETAVVSGKDRSEIVGLASAYHPPIRTWDREAWNAVLASGVGAHVSSQTIVDWSTPYRTIPELQSVNTQERSDLAALQVSRLGADRLSPTETEALLAAVQKLRNENREMARLSRTEYKGLELEGLSVQPATRRHILDGLKGRFGDCVITPSSAGVDPDDQLQSLGPHPQS